MKKTLFASLIALLSAGVNAELIQHTDQIAEVKFTGSTMSLASMSVKSPKTISLIQLHVLMTHWA